MELNSDDWGIPGWDIVLRTHSLGPMNPYTQEQNLLLCNSRTAFVVHVFLFVHDVRVTLSKAQGGFWD